jgi:hypothetical protein
MDPFWTSFYTVVILLILKLMTHYLQPQKLRPAHIIVSILSFVAVLLKVL